MLKELAAQKNLRTLNLHNTQVTDAGLKELAKLEDLQLLNLGVAIGSRVLDCHPRND